MFARYAIPEVVAGVVVGAGMTVAATLVHSVGAGLVPAGLLAGWLWFFRDPPRRTPAEPGVLYAPADGRVVSIERIGNASPTTDSPQIRITIFLSVFDVHVQRFPVAGVALSTEHRSGRHLNALRQRSSIENESLALVLEPSDRRWLGSIQVRQIAGAVARRIVCDAKPGERLAAGQRYGMIKFGSRVEISLRDRSEVQIMVTVGQRVRAGVSPLAQYLDSASAAEATNHR